MSGNPDSRNADITVVKIGGATFGNHDPIIADIVELQRRGRPLVVVHGGGRLVSEWLARQGEKALFIRGERVTDRPTLDVVTAVLAGLVNKDIVAAIAALGGRAVGISGVDGALIRGRKRDDDMGYVGETVEADPAVLQALLGSGFVPIVAPVSLYSEGRSADDPGMLNMNGDPMAGDIAAALSAQRLVFLTDVAGITDGHGNLLPALSPEEARELVDTGIASGGMIPKITACVRALDATATTCVIDGREPHALLRAVEGDYVGTTIETAPKVQGV